MQNSSLSRCTKQTKYFRNIIIRYNISFISHIVKRFKNSNFAIFKGGGTNEIYQKVMVGNHLPFEHVIRLENYTNPNINFCVAPILTNTHRPCVKWTEIVFFSRAVLFLRTRGYLVNNRLCSEGGKNSC